MLPLHLLELRIAMLKKAAMVAEVLSAVTAVTTAGAVTL